MYMLFLWTGAAVLNSEKFESHFAPYNVKERRTFASKQRNIYQYRLLSHCFNLFIFSLD
jgi:hypothetical protein